MTGLVASAFWVFVPPMSAAASGQEVCNECHEEVVTAFAGSFHGKAWSGMGKSSGCQSCHGSADKHKDDPSKATIITFGKDSMQSAAEQSERCLKCHSDSAALAFWEMGAHQANDVTCTNCHSIHQSKNVVSQPQTCEGCHRSVKTEINKQSHHPIKEGKVKCSDCHNPHGDFGPSMIRAASVNELCYKCHSEKRGPYMWEHPPVEENCLTCHTVHGSNHRSLLAKKTPYLCQSCHAWTQHPSTVYGANASFVNGGTRQFVGRNCLNCHTNVHGSNAPGTLGLRYVR